MNIVASRGKAKIAAPVSWVHLNQPSGSRCGDLPSVLNDASPESSPELVAAVAPPLQLGLLVPKRPFLCLCRSLVSHCLPYVGLLQRLILWVRPTFRAHVAFLTKVPTNNFIVGILTLALGLCLLSCRSCQDLSLSCIYCRLCQCCPHPSMGRKVVILTTHRKA